jgi:probable FeS assembly SUF system protein SufT
MALTTLTLVRDCKAAIIPAGDEVLIPKGSTLDLMQHLGGSLTVTWKGILCRIDESEKNSIDPEQLSALEVAAPARDIEGREDFSESLIWATLKTCYDPEIPINIVDLGLIYDLHHEAMPSGKHEVKVTMTLTAQGCGMGPVIAEDARRKIEALECVESASVLITWDPPWTPHMISQEGRKRLGME